MATLSPKAIVITAYSGAHDMIKMSPRKPEYSLLDPVDFDSDDSTCSGAPRKRRRLTHLSPDEKLLRRKLKNRVAAQTARDRKKALMTELEERVAKLEEENKLLKRQNVSLKEASNNLIKENTELKSRLSDEPQTTIKTETDTFRSAAPAVPLQKEQVQILSRWMAQYLAFVITLSFWDSVGDKAVQAAPRELWSKSDDFFGLLQELAQDVKLEHPQAQATASISSSVSGGSRGGEVHQSREPSTSSAMVGLSSAELESLNELIQIDHVYVKPQPSAASSKQGGRSTQQQQHKSTMPASPKKESSTTTSVPSSNNGSHSKISCLPSPKPEESKLCVTVPGLKRQHNGQAVITLHSSLVTAPPATGSLETMATQPEAVVTTESELLFTENNVTDSFVGSFSDTDMATSLNFLNDFGMDFLVSDEPQLNFDLAANTDTSGDSSYGSVPDPSFLKVEEITCASPPSSELNPIKLFDEIYEHYLNIQETPKTADSPNPSVNSDSGLGSDVEPMSPLSSGESLHDEYFFHDLFPGLQ